LDETQSDALGVSWEDLTRELYFGAGGSYLYRPICKCATTTIKTLLLEFEGLPVDADVWRRHQRNLNGFPGIDHLSRAEIEAILSGSPTIFKFTFVRNPFKRMASAYQDKILREDLALLEKFHAMARAIGRVLSQPISFEEFIELALDQDIAAMDPHYRPQFYEGAFSVIRYDFVGRVESMEDDLRHVFDCMSKGRSPILRAPEKLNQTVAAPHLWGQVSARTMDRFLAKYECDFATFRYAQIPDAD
jgi:hypothetical protein